MINVVGRRKIFYTFSILLIGAGIFSTLYWGFLQSGHLLRFGIDFTGGSFIEIEFAQARPEAKAIKDVLSGLGLGDAAVQSAGDRGIIIRTKDLDEPSHQRALQALASLGALEEKKFDSIGPVVGEELKGRAYLSIITVLFLIVIYIAFAFRKVSRPVASWKYGLAAIIALFHDIFIPIGVFSVLGHYLGVEIDLLFVTGLLTILGFSVHDTIVVFDRIRENLRKGLGENFKDTVNISINQTMTRSINTSLTVFLTLLAIFIFGGESVKYFSLLLMIGVFFGTYSSIFVASSLLVTWEDWRQKRIAKKMGK
ncbi:MAG: protein translocase subunit SecF [Candidatus Portnoybacteria bacterium]|nr:protein translocase subunit SecF [Candidatus Portnoybacteria bacterium]MDD4982438.1 protein translocase subunit SecF [Candidatus Portnoybacteria bacterium]